MHNLLDETGSRGQYEILNRIGSGGFGEVYKAHDKQNNRNVAIKVFQKQLGQDDNAAIDWEREAQHALSLKDKHIIESYEFVQPSSGDDTGLYYLVMEYAAKGSLKTLIETRKAQNDLFQEAIVIDTFRQMLLGLQAVHKTALHRDIKPENMLFVDDVLKLSDFGLAKHIDQATRTRTYKGWGTYIYMAPESWSLGKMTQATDIYSLGIVLYELATLQLPFSSADIKELENLHKYGDRPRAKAINPNISSKLNGIIYKMMMQSATNRYQSVDEILQDLDTTPAIVSLSPALQQAATLAQQLHAKKTKEETAQQKRQEQRIERTKKNIVQIKEFVRTVEEVIDSFNQNVPESKIMLSKGSSDNYTIIWQGTDLLQMRINPYIETIKLRGQPITSYVEVVYRVQARPNEGMCFILCFEENDDSDYGQWKILENTYSPLMISPGVYPLQAEYSQLKILEQQGNAIGQFQYHIRDNVKEELENLINRAFEYQNKPPQAFDVETSQDTSLSLYENDEESLWDKVF